jgi:hypothetical protein
MKPYPKAQKEFQQDLQPILQRLRENDDFQAYRESLSETRERFIRLAYNSDYDQSQNKALGAVAVLDEILLQTET